MPSNDNQVTARLAHWIATLTPSDIDETARHEARRAILNYFAVALAACHDNTIEKAVAVMLPHRATEQASLIGRRERFDMLNAAALNAMAANVHDFDDTHTPTIMHPTAPVAAALFALAQTRALSGEAFVTAFLAGVEIECRIANAISPHHYARGWHITSTCGVFGAAAAACKALRIEGQQIVWALGNAAAQAGGLVETLGTSAKSISVGNAARNGLASALLAQAGFEGPAAPLEGTFGYLKVVNGNVDWRALDGELPARWQIQRNTYKPYPCGVVLNPVIDACLDIAAGPDFTARDTDTIASIELIGHPLLRQRTDRPGVASGRMSQVSAQHAVGVTLTRRRAGLAEFSDAAVADPAVRALGGKIAFVDDATMSVDAAQVRVHFADGHKLVARIDAARGSRARPLTDQELAAKLRSLCEYGGSGVIVDKLINAVWTLDQQRDAGDIPRLAAPTAF